MHVGKTRVIYQVNKRRETTCIGHGRLTDCAPCASADETQSPLLPVNSSQQEYCITNDGDVLVAGDSWKANACTSCTCNNGTIQCFSQSCPAAHCRVPVLRKGQCCPHCLGECLGSEPAARPARSRRFFLRNAVRPRAAAFCDCILLPSVHSRTFPVPGSQRFLYGSAGSEKLRVGFSYRGTPQHRFPL